MHSPRGSRRRTWASVALLAVVAAVALTPPRLVALQPERFTALAVNMGEPVRWSTLNVEIAIDRWSTDGERDRLFKVLNERGPDKLLDALRKIPRVGYIRTPDRVGYDLHFARRTPGEDGGERIVLATDRYITFWEARNRPRTVDYPFTIVELRIGSNGEGEGKRTRVAMDAQPWRSPPVRSGAPRPHSPRIALSNWLRKNLCQPRRTGHGDRHLVGGDRHGSGVTGVTHEAREGVYLSGVFSQKLSDHSGPTCSTGLRISPPHPSAEDLQAIRDHCGERSPRCLTLGGWDRCVW